jgi:hypothetical protein
MCRIRAAPSGSGRMRRLVGEFVRCEPFRSKPSRRQVFVHIPPTMLTAMGHHCAGFSLLPSPPSCLFAAHRSRPPVPVD